ncbi:DNA-binding LacI/PurR family transcriptional regulator [Kineococcus xinjiangensis]|uniref:DNA-binding LacI/PurR family transcriptional regulator n=1 Tax=Kineococcus xinjiangensis TaxID=512762 RepID=A0A2S6IT48_9ACTN|nr:LacI family DNA-binding transcriptional regulator [Kineococcus xinjiangensis]PPK97427.1 DNA-binding LacI/PurR family transcriptional regulator [Kineococcus xinjiangensis]
MPAPRATTLRDVAEAAGVSIKTVSNVVNDHPHVRPEMRERVLAVIERLDYRPQAIGRQLRHGRTGMLALAVPQMDMPYFAELACNLVAAARSRGLTVLVEQTDGLAEREREVAAGFPVRIVDGLVFSPLNLPDAELAQRRDRTPVVLVGEHGRDTGIDRVSNDSVEIGRLATAHLLDCGRRRIGMIGTKLRSPHLVATDRHAGYRRALDDAGVPADPALLSPTDGWGREEGERSTDLLLEQAPDVDAVFAPNDVMALGALRSLRRHGRRVPDDVAVVGVDDIAEASYAAPTLSTVAIDRAFIAETALDLLIRRIGGDDSPPRTAIAPHRLVVRESTCG